MTFLYVDDATQLAYSPGRAAVGEWMRGLDRWIFAGWLWDGEVRDVDHARELIGQYLAV